MILELIEKKKEELKASKKWEEYNRLKKEERDYKSIKGQGAKLEEKKHEYDGLKRYTILKREYLKSCLLYTSPSPRDQSLSRMPSSA